MATPLPAKLALVGGSPVSVKVLDVSMGGAAVVVLDLDSYEFQRGKDVEATFGPGILDGQSARARVRYAEHAGDVTRVGLQWLELPDAALAGLREVVSSSGSA